ncbi:fasciclin domain-containing protein [Gramella sp. MAR_2010_147]|uniref:fasciclin domain-containing protein n=1 Tax=Gramella sp. MAR_2010_147 TaxID=1250205 RepID=UPI00087A0505|nr:fasciclin domain-containing protein [Gramella sp. MAR_2010_147]SDS61594.1 Uncaracterized surface protein containing fasciclin (FAS1) repeats [Gramella sp. MAR_2010_147]
MKIKMLFTVLALSAIIFTSCEDNKKKEEAEKERMEQMEAEREAEMQAEKEKMEMESNSIAAKAMATDTLSTLVEALKSAELAEMFKTEEGPFTVFAPNNAAFSKVDETTMEELMMEENQAKLAGILKYHVVDQKVMASDLVKMINDNDGKYSINTVGGGKLDATLEGDKVILTDENGNKATVVQADVDASNGVVHIIDAVVMKKAS